MGLWKHFQWLRGSKDWRQKAGEKAQEKVQSMFDRGYEHLGKITVLIKCAEIQN